MSKGQNKVKGKTITGFNSQSIERAFVILNLLKAKDLRNKFVTVSYIGLMTHLSVSTAYRIVQDLVTAGYVVKNHERRYSLAQLEKVEKLDSFYETVLPFCKRLQERGVDELAILRAKEDIRLEILGETVNT